MLKTSLKTCSSRKLQLGRVTMFCLFGLLAGSLGACDTPEAEDDSSSPSESADSKSEESEESKPSKSKSKDSPKDSPEDSPKTEDDPSEESPSESGTDEPEGSPESPKDSPKDSPKESPKDPDSESGEDPGKEDGAQVRCEGKSPKVVLETSMGKITLVLDGENSPITVANFTQYVNDKFFDQTLFHRIIDGFVIQGGGYDINNKLKPTRDPIKLEINNKLKHVDGTISMARTDDPNSANSQFFICDGQSKCRQLDGKYAAFGSTVEGIEVVRKISAVPTGGGNEGKPREKVVIEKAYCIR